MRAGFNADHGEYSRHDQKADGVVDAVHDATIFAMRSLRRCSHAPNISPATYTATRDSASCAVHRYKVGPQSLVSAFFMVWVDKCAGPTGGAGLVGPC